MPKISAIPLSKARARRIWLRAQRLDEARRSATGRRRRPRRSSTSAMCRSTPSTWSSAATTRSSTRASRTTGASICARRSHRQDRLRVLDARALLRADARHALLHARHEARAGERSSWFCAVKRGDLRKVLGRIRRNGAAHDPRHRRRRAGGKGRTNGRAASLPSARCSSRSTAACSRSASARAC